MSDQETFISHLIELRDRLLHTLIALGVAFIPCFVFARDLYTLLATPLIAKLPAGSQMIATDVTGAFFVPMKVAMMVAFLVALPYVLYQVWAFVAPGLYQNEKKLAIPLIITSTLLFFVGMAFAYFAVFPMVFKFVVGYTPEGVAMMTDINNYLSFVLTLFLAFGVTFETPVVVIILVRMNIVSVEKLREIRPYVVVGAFVLGAIFTPPDIVSQFMLAIPIWVLYEVGIVLASMMVKARATEDQQSAA
ncbi:MAG: twin-arginine translocase subunit TatC [Pseudomonadota bacterium]|nr:twin-arginine translocase subunit TatC [Pseudomonadota bacterium]